MPIEVEPIEQLVFETVNELHPDLLTPGELVLKLATDPDLPEGGGDPVRQAIMDLKRSGVLRNHGGLVAATHAAACTVALLSNSNPDDTCRQLLHTCKRSPS